MRNTEHLTDEQRRELWSEPLSDEAAETMRKVDKADRWLLALALEELDCRDADPDYDPADDPLCVRVELENDKE